MSTPKEPDMPDPSSSWFIFTYAKLKFFNRIRRFLQLKASKKRQGPSDQKPDDNSSLPAVTIDITRSDQGEDVEISGGGWVVLQRSVKRLHFGSWDEKVAAAEEIKGLAKDNNLKRRRRKAMAELGVIPPLVEMVGSEVAERRRVAVQALVELANNSYTNKALILEAGILLKLPIHVDDVEESTQRELTELLLSVSSPTSTQFPLASSPRTVPFLVSTLESNSNLETKELCLATIFNLSTMFYNVGALVSHGTTVTVLLRLASMKETAEKSLATLGNLVVTPVGKRMLENHSMVPDNLIEILTWEEKPKCQEFSAYVLMILAHQSSEQREKMSKAGIVPVLLEVALLGSPLAQKRALKLLQWFKDERQVRMGPHSGPQTGRLSMGSPVNQRDADEGRKLMKKIVRQSLYKNMETIIRRANDDEGCSKFKALVISSSSKSLPY